MEIPPLDEEAERLARARQATLTKPPGSLGRLEDLACQMAAIQGSPRPRGDRKWVVVAAADHGVTSQGVSAYPSDVTAQMVANFLRGGAAVSVLAREAHAQMVIVDAGVAGPIPGDTSGLRRVWEQSGENPEALKHDASETASASKGPSADRESGGPGGEASSQAGSASPVRAGRPGTADFTKGPAMSRSDAEAVLAYGMHVAQEIADEGADLIAPGEMGIGNTTSASALTAVITGVPVESVTGLGTGIDPERRRRKVAAIETAIRVNHPEPEDGVGILAAVGGYEIGVLAGLMLGAAANRVAIALDGFIATAAALVAAEIRPGAAAYFLPCHLSTEPGHAIALGHLGLRPLLELEMRLGEGTGAVLGMTLIEAAVSLHNGMATFEEASVSGPAAEAHSSESKG